MAWPTCVKCGGHAFQIQKIEPSGGRYKQNLVQCSACGVPVGVLDFFNTGAQLEELKELIQKLADNLADVQSRIHRIEQFLSRQ